jgi:hypothetical protein
MLKSIKNIFILLIVSLFFLSCQDPKGIYYPIRKHKGFGNLKIVFIRTEGTTPRETSMGDFYIDDKNQIEKLQDNWGFSTTDIRMSCGFGYIVYIMTKDSILEQLSIKSDCGYMISNSVWYGFDEKYYDHIDLSKVHKLTREECDVYFNKRGK